VTRTPSGPAIGENPGPTTRASFANVPLPPGWSDETPTTVLSAPVRVVPATIVTVAVSPAASEAKEQLTRPADEPQEPVLDETD